MKQLPLYLLIAIGLMTISQASSQENEAINSLSSLVTHLQKLNDDNFVEDHYTVQVSPAVLNTLENSCNNYFSTEDDPSFITIHKFQKDYLVTCINNIK